MIKKSVGIMTITITIIIIIIIKQLTALKKVVIIPVMRCLSSCSVTALYAASNDTTKTTPTVTGKQEQQLLQQINSQKKVQEKKTQSNKKKFANLWFEYNGYIIYGGDAYVHADTHTYIHLQIQVHTKGGI